MQIWPAIDLRGGLCVRLRQGDYDRETVFGDDPAEMARRWVQQGADCLHLVDLDGARLGRGANREAVLAILASVDVPCELGGGVRDESTIQAWLAAGIARLVVGTRALKEPDWFRAMCRGFPEQLVLGIDARAGRVATDGWRETSDVAATEFAELFDQEPLAAIIYTDIAADGMLAGPNSTAMAEMKAVAHVPVIASGGVSSAADVRRLTQIGLDGCIIGRALYEGKLTIAAAIQAANLEK